jgi:hypothetical protein
VPLRQLHLQRVDIISATGFTQLGNEIINGLRGNLAWLGLQDLERGGPIAFVSGTASHAVSLVRRV